jgi:hypothetical protein
MEVSSQLFRTCFTPGERPSLLIDRKLGGQIADPDVLEKRKSVALAGNQTPDYPVRNVITTFSTLSPLRGTAVLNITVTLKAHCTFQYSYIIFRHVSKIFIVVVPEDIHCY